MNQKTLLLGLGGVGLLVIGIVIGAALSPMMWNSNTMFANMPPAMLEQMAENGMTPMMGGMRGGMMGGMMGGWWMIGLVWIGSLAGIAALIIVLARPRASS